MMWKKLIAGLLSASVVCASLTAVALNLGLNRAAGVAPDAMLYEQRYEAEDAQHFGGAGKATDHTGYTGSGFVAGLDQDGRGLTFTVTVPRADRYMIGIRYACTNGASTLSLYTGEDLEQAQKVSFSKVKDNNWDNWNTTYVTMPLEAGENQLSFQRVAGVNGGAVNMDSITVTDAAIYEAEDAAFLPENWGMATGHVGYSGRGFMEGWGTDGRAMVFTVNADRDGVYTVALRYQSAQGDTRTLNVYVNDETDARTAEFPRNNGGWSDDVWSNTYMNLPLKAGENTIKIAKEADVNGNINIDSLIVPNRLLTASEVTGGVQNGNFENDYEGWTMDNPDNKCSGINGANNVVGKNLYMWDGSAFQQGVSQELTGLDSGWYALSYWKQNNANAPKSQTNELLAGEDGVSASFTIPYSTGGFWYPMGMVAKPGADGKLRIHIATDANAGASTMIAKFRLWKLVDKSALYDQIASGKDLLEADYTAETWQAYQAALSAARETLRNGDSQPAVDAAAAALAEKQGELAAPKPPAQYAPSSLIIEQKYEAEDGELIGGAEMQLDHGGYTGRGFVAQTDQTDQPRGTAITVNVPQTGSYTVGIRYAAGSNATMGVYVNDSADAKTVDLFRTKDGWESWSTSYVNLALEQGENTITILRRKGANPDQNAANIDFITLTDAAVYEAEDAEIIPAHREPATDHTGCSGRGFMAGLGDKGRGMIFTVDAQRDGMYTLAFRYQSAHGNTRTMHAYANDGAAATVSFPKNNRDWGDDYWSFAYVDLELKAGENAVKLVNDEGVDG
ncbi:MAG: carbohydrate-binding protein, partial [Clostridiales bacterium]|nr:carbohydrate-binding protein [Clostridiales bacterium]